MTSMSITEVFNKISMGSSSHNIVSMKHTSFPSQTARTASFNTVFKRTNKCSFGSFSHNLTGIKSLPQIVSVKKSRERRQKAELDFVCVGNGAVPKGTIAEMREEWNDKEDFEIEKNDVAKIENTASDASSDTQQQIEEEEIEETEDVDLEGYEQDDEMANEEEEEEINIEEEDEEMNMEEEEMIEKPDRFEIKELMTELRDTNELGKRGEMLFLSKILAFTLIVFPPLNIRSLTFSAGCLIMLSGIGCAIYGTINLGRSVSPFLTPRKSSELVTNGIFSYVRHPIYGGMLLFSLGLAITTRNELRLILTGLLWWILEKVMVYEEETLIRRYGDDYDDYRKYVKSKYIPGVY